MATKKTAAKATRATKQDATTSTSTSPGWTFLTNHAHVLFCLAERPDDVRVRDVAVRVGITERAVQRILGELEAAGYIERTRVGRRSVYVLDDRLPLRHAIESHRSVADLLALVFEPAGGRSTATRKASKRSSP
jgi:hypothetical protein